MWVRRFVCCLAPLIRFAARDFCEGAGARLCSGAEHLNDEARGTGCSYDAEYLWSRTPCTSSDDGGSEPRYEVKKGKAAAVGAATGTG